MEYKEKIEIAIKGAKEAAKEILRIYNSEEFDTKLKDDQSPLTLADKRGHEIISFYLEKTNLPILSEEGKNIDFEERRNWEYFWLVDPLDGTKEFVKKNGQFTVNIALIQNNKPIWGIVIAPVLNKVYFIDENNIAFVEENGKLQQLEKKKAEIDLSSENIKVVASKSHLDERTQAFIDQLKNPTTISVGSSLKFMMIAERKADIYPRFAPTSEWDTAAAHAILNNLGYKIFNNDDASNEISYNKENILNPYFIVK
jgi:3'(2'), 5'-bisphosphate nucleotidase